MKAFLRKLFSFANIIILVCVAVALFVTVSVVYEYHRLGVVMEPEMVKGFWLFWGGELLIVCLRQVFGSDVVRGKNKTDDREEQI